jgi:hypothetical protein
MTRALIKKQKSATTSNGRRSWPELLEAWKIDAKSESMRMYKRLNSQDMHTKLMTPQLILSAVTSTLAKIYRPCPRDTLTALTVVVAIVCTVLGAITNFVEFNVVSKTQRRSKEIRIALQTSGKCQTISMRMT